MNLSGTNSHGGHFEKQHQGINLAVKVNADVSQSLDY